MRFNHTPGNWRYYKPEGSNGFYYVDTEFNNGGEIATCYLENAEANARLIAAAPDMLDTLIKAYTVLEYVSDYDIPLTTHESIKTVIEKATGKTIEQILQEDK